MAWICAFFLPLKWRLYWSKVRPLRAQELLLSGTWGSTAASSSKVSQHLARKDRLSMNPRLLEYSMDRNRNANEPERIKSSDYAGPMSQSPKDNPVTCKYLSLSVLSLWQQKLYINNSKFSVQILLQQSTTVLSLYLQLHWHLGWSNCSTFS